jgi:hypothetical protein
MKKSKTTGPRIRRYGLIFASAILAILAIVASRTPNRAQSAGQTPTTAQSNPQNPAPQPAGPQSAQPVSASAAIQRRPFAVTLTRGGCEWTSEDGRETNIIRRLAHNELEVARMVDENKRIFRRQLVYRTETAAALIERAKLTGETIRQLTLPGLDGQEVQFEITRADLNPSGLQGAFSGHVAGKSDSMVTLAFKGNREAFTILSPSDGLYFQADPREPGEVILTQIDPATYIVGVCGNP